MVPKRKSEEQDDHAIGMGDSKKKKPKGPGIALVIAIGHKGKHDKDAMKKAWPMLKEQKTLYEPEWDQQAYDEQGHREHLLAMQREQFDQEGAEDARWMTGVDSRNSGVPDASAFQRRRRTRAPTPGNQRLPPLSSPPKLPDYKSGFADDYDPDAKEKDAGF